MPSQAGVASVILDTSLPQLDHFFEYRIPENLAGQLVVGCKVSVPLRGGSRFSDAFVTSISDKAKFLGELQYIEKIITPLPLLSPETIDLSRKIADRQAGSAMDVIRLIIPTRYVRAEKAFVAGPHLVPGHVKAVPLRPDEFLDLQVSAGSKYALLAPPHLMFEGESTSSNWVELFTALAAEQLELGKSTIMAVPDFRDINKLERALRSSGLGAHFVRVDAKLSGQDRYLNYLRSIQEEPLVILGNRSASLSPANNLGLILLWDDGDHNFEEPLSPYTHTRDVTLVRQAQTDCAVIFASHSRSLETQRLVEIGWLLEAPVRVVEQPQIVLTDPHLDEGERSSRIPSVAWLGAKKALDFGPVLVQVASPGFAPAVVCAQCNERAMCTGCSGPLKLSHKSSLPSCRWCGHMNTTWSCVGCGGIKIRPVAAGTERTSEEIGRAFPGVKVIVADSGHILETVSSEPAVIVATPGAEPVAEGGYSAVLLLDGERLRGREAFRVDEDVLRNWSNTIALAKKNAHIFINGAGLVLGKALTESSQTAWAAHEFADRQSLRLPPSVRVVSITGPTETVRSTCDGIPLTASFRVLGPVGQADGAARALIFFEYKDGDAISTFLRAAVITSATRSKKPPVSAGQSPRVLRLRVRFDDPDIDSL